LARPVLLALLPAVLIATGWRQLELPAQGGEIALVALLAVAVAASQRRLFQVGASVAGLLVTLHLAFGLRPVGGIFTEFASGLVDYYEFALPFNPAERTRMHGIVLLAVFAFTLAAAAAISRRRPVLAAALTFAGAAWPVTLNRQAPTTARGILLLLSALLLFALPRRPEARRGGAQTVLAGAGIVLAAAIAVSSPAVAKGGFLNWERWEPYTRPKPPTDVSYVWNADYNGIKFPKQGTPVLTIKAPRGVSYWRATTLDSFFKDHWIERASPIEPVPVDDRDALIADPLVPPAARDPDSWLRQEVTVRALSDAHLVGATVPIAFERGAGEYYAPGVAEAARRPRRGETYEVWSYIPQPRPRDLARSRPNYPTEIASGGAFLETPSGIVPAFGIPQRDAAMRELFAQRYVESPYNRLYQVARQVVGRPRSPYAAVIALEAWFRSPIFTYDESPPVRKNAPPLVAFVTRDRRGYCQHFAGAMALMLRYLGIPARVGAGFTTGRYNVDRGEWTVSDTNAHTWVEVWFKGYGWLPFDPTPGRGRLSSPYTASSFTFDVAGAQSLLAGVGQLGRDALESGASDPRTDRLRGVDPPGQRRPADGEGGGGGIGSSLVGLLLLIAAAVTTALWLLKSARRRARYLTNDPRRLAGAVRLDLVDFLVDQRLPIAASATPAEVGSELERSLGVRGERLAEALAEARYGPEARAEDAVERARKELRTVRRRVRRRLGLRDRFLGLISLRSLGLGSP
jgi:transglutaminase-like putative cysteine protease